MPTALFYPTTTNAVQKTLDAALLTGVTASATLNNVTGIQNLKGLMVVDRVDANSVLTPSKREYISFTGTSGSTVVTLVRGLAGSTDQDHAVGAIVEFVNDVVQQQAIIDGLLNVNTTAGALDTTKVVDLTTAQTLTNKRLTSPKINEDVAMTASATELNVLDGIPATLTATELGYVDGVTSAIQTQLGTKQATVIAPNTYVGEVGNVTTSATTELTAITKTITNPAVAGQIFMTGSISVNTPTAADDFFIYKFYFNGNVLNTFTKTEPSTGGGGRSVVTFSAAAAVANSGTQIMKITVTRDTGTGTISVEGARCYLSWVIFPGASTTA
jgi:hypothetical protein